MREDQKSPSGGGFHGGREVELAEGVVGKLR